MRKILILFLSVFFLLPSFSYADCGKNGTTVVFINGLRGNEAAAKQDKIKLEQFFKQKFGNQDVKFINGFNESHVGGATDLIKSIMQSYGYKNLDVDLTTILNNAHDEIKTQKIVLVGHSQGAFYTNAAYEYLIKNGVSEKSIAVYNIATPDERVAGGGKYLTSSTDKLINEIRRLAEISGANKPLPANVGLELSEKEKADPYGGHSFSDVYLALASGKIIGDIDTAINSLEIDENFEDTGDGCFVKPGENLSYKVKKLTLALVEDGINDVVAEGTSAWTTDTILVRMTQFLASLFGKNNPTTAATITEQNDTPDVSFFNEESKKQVKEVSEQIEEVIFGTGFSDPNALPDSLEDILDDIAEKLDIITRQILNLQEDKEDLSGESSSLASNEDTKTEDEDNNVNKNNDETIAESGSNYSSSGSSVNYPKILISEVQMASSTDEKSEFIELYNPNDTDADLTGWYLQRKTAEGKNYSTYASNTLFSGLKISAKSYFLIARKGYFAKLADISVDNPITKDNSFVLKNPGGQISDKLGFGAADDYENFVAKNPGNSQTIGRKMVGETEQDTEDNSVDFEFQTPTPKAQNTTYVQEPQPGGGDGTLGKDTKAPEISFNINPVQITADFAISFTVTDVADAVSPSGVDSYIFRWQEDDGAWQQDASVKVSGCPTSVSLTRDFAGQDGKTYYFQAKANDVDGNESDWQPEIPIETKVTVPKKILINEIQIDGTADKKEEFVELYNPNGVDVDLTGWYLQRKTAEAEDYSSYATSALFEGKTIKAGGYFLIARTGYFSELANILTDNPLTEDNSLVLKRQDRSISDKVGWGSATDFETAAAVAPIVGKSIERKIIGGDTDNNSADFKVSENSTPGKSFIVSTIKDNTNYGNNFSDADLVYFYNLSLGWNSSISDSDVDFFDVQYKLNDENWQNWLTKTKDTSADFKAFYSLIEQNNKYSFRVKSQDIYGNQSDWQEIDIDLSVPIVINEIALHGTTSNQKDNWIELYNKSDMPVDITGWQISSDSNKITLSGIIPAKGYFLLERGNDDVLPNIAADQIFTEAFTGSSIYLLDGKNRRLDEVYNNGNWHHIENKYLSLERISPYSYGFIKENWKLNDEKITNDQKDRDGNLINGTPGSQNSYYQLYTFLPLSFGRNILLPKFLSPYVFGETLKIPQNITLTIEPGTVLKAINSVSRITVNGTLSAVGTSDEKIIFTSFLDDEYGGDTNNDSGGSAPSEGNWLGIEIAKNCQNSKFDYVVFRYAGGSLDSFGTALKVNQSSVFISNSVFENIKNKGVYLINSSSTIESTKFLNILNSDSSGFNAVGIQILGGADKILNNYFRGNNNGITLENWSSEDGTVFETNPLIKDNTFEKNIRPVYVWSFNNPVFSGNKAADNNYNAIILFESVIKKDVTLDADLPYFSDGLFEVPENIILTLKPGVIFSPSGLMVRGTLKAVGTLENPIIFRDYYWNQEWAQRPGKWFGLSFEKTSKDSELENIEIFYAGDFYYSTGRFGAAVRVDNCDISLKDSYIHDNKNQGIWLQNSNSIIDNVRFYNHTEAQNSGDASAIYIQGGRPEVKNSYFDKQKYGIILDKWEDSETGEIILPNANLHDGLLDIEENIFINTEKFNIFNISIPS